MYLDSPFNSARWAAFVGGLLALVLATPVALGSGLGLVVTVGDVDVAGLPPSYRPPELDDAAATADPVALDPRFAEAEARFAADPDLTACLDLVSAAIASTRVTPGGPPELVAALASAAHISFSAGKSELADAAIALLVERAPAVTLDPQRYSPDVIEALERARGPLGPLLEFSVSAAPAEDAPSGCGLDVGVERLGLSVRLPARSTAVILRCGTERTSPITPRSGAVVVPAWRLGAVVTQGRVRVSTSARATQLATELLASKTVPWAAVIARQSSGAFEAHLHRGGRVDRLVGDASGISQKLDAALADAPTSFDTVAEETPGGPAWWHWGLIGIGAAAVVAGGVLNGLAAEQVESELNAGNDVWDDVEAKKVGFWSLYGTGAALSLTGTILAAIAAADE